ncbi:hypothetical protein AB0I82_22250 [Streptomyces sp. NPDC050315]|uniref:hypothetical protein n=1 Tax=Streptomyces sp. NPDC050315 TaxID=3155039 RepID=UPI00344682F3
MPYEAQDTAEFTEATRRLKERSGLPYRQLEEKAAVPTGPVLLHPLSAPDPCLTDGRVPDGRYDSLVAVQRPCDEVGPQRTTLIPAGSGLYRIQWFSPDQGKGRLAARSTGPAAGLREPRNDCGHVPLPVTTAPSPPGHSPTTWNTPARPPHPMRR